MFDFITPDTFLQTLPMLAKGMVGIFIVTALLVLSIMVMNRLTAPKKDEQ